VTSRPHPVDAEHTEPAASLHLPCLLAGLALMLVGSVDPRLFADSQGRPDHAVAGLAMWAMSAGIVRGVGFVPRHRAWRLLFSGWACLLALVAAVLCRFGH
jgi:predicted membrane protein